MHTPVLLHEAIDALEVFAGGRYIDATYGYGGHSAEIVKRGGWVLALEWDTQVVSRHRSPSAVVEGPPLTDNQPGYTLIWSNYAAIEERAKEYHFASCDGVIFDLGLSMGQISGSGRGFSYKALSDRLDMRIWEGLTQTAADIVAHYSEEELYELFAKYSQEINSRPLARAIVLARRIRPLGTVGDLVQVIEKVVLKDTEATCRRIFQALRIEVNGELENIEEGLKGAIKIVKQGGPIVVITFHETEDRLVKRFAQKNDISLKTIRPKGNTSARFEKSAKIRILKKFL